MPCVICLSNGAHKPLAAAYKLLLHSQYHSKFKEHEALMPGGICIARKCDL